MRIKERSLLLLLLLLLSKKSYNGFIVNLILNFSRPFVSYWLLNKNEYLRRLLLARVAISSREAIVVASDKLILQLY